MSYFTETLINQVWQKAKIVEGFDPTRWRKDFADAWIQKDQYGIQSSFGWEIDHLKPQCVGGTDEMSNLNPIHWENNRAKGADYPRFATIITSEGNKNVCKKKTWLIQ